MRPRNKIIVAQEQYLKTKDQAYLVQVYNGVLALGLTIQMNEPKVSQDQDAAADIASNVCLRLMESQEPVISSAPSGYIKSALYYKNKETFHDDVDDHDDGTEDDERNDYTQYVSKLLDGMSFPDTETESLVRATLDARVNWHLVQRNLNGDLKRNYSDKMREIKAYAKDHLQSNRMLQTC